MEKPRDAAELEPEGLAERDVTIDVGGQHDATSGHGWAISERRPKSTLA
jgi:hypothetical protein